MIQKKWREFRLWKFSYNPVYPKVIVDGSDMYGYYPNLCATKLQALFRGHRVRQSVPMEKMSVWIVDNILFD
jgi:hypothetical protein